VCLSLLSRPLPFICIKLLLPAYGSVGYSFMNVLFEIYKHIYIDIFVCHTFLLFLFFCGTGV
jgi:hypothetical protein